MKRFHLIARLIVGLAAVVALIPLGRMTLDWLAVSRMIGQPALYSSARSYDWVTWKEEDGLIVAAYVFPRNQSNEQGLQEGDVFYQLDYQQYFNLEDLQRAIEGIPPGSIRTYSVLRDNREVWVDVLFTRYPTFLYPLSPSLWQFSIWGFVFGAFFHALGLVIAGPLARRSPDARYALLLIAVSSLWMFGNLFRLLMIEVLGPLEPGTMANRIFEGLTLLGLVGWIGFPALLLAKVVRDAERIADRRVGPLALVLYVPAIILGLLALWTTLRGSVGPITLGGLVAPILFYACCYIAAAATFVLILYLARKKEVEDVIGGWPLTGSAGLLVVSVLFGLSVLGVVPIFGAVTDIMAGWLIVCAQLLFIVPVVLVSLATLKHGKIDQVLSRALTYLTVLGLIFFAFVAGFTLVEPFLERTGTNKTIVAGLYVVLLLVVFERLARRVRIYAAHFFATERQQARQQLSRFQEQMRSILDHETLAQRTMDVVGEAFRIRTGRLYLCPLGPDGPWISRAYHPEPPYLTERVVLRVWPFMRQEGAIWARNPELNESAMPEDLAHLLSDRNVALAVPIMGNSGAIGLLVLGPRRDRNAVYNLEDLDMLRSLCGQLALAVERLNLVERERALIRESAEAQLSALRAQINPHFLFNALNTIVSLIEEHPEQAVEAVEHLAAIFRHILQTGGRPYVTVEEEFALVSNYLGIEKARFGPRLQIDVDVDPELSTSPVPAFVVQTLVENAVKHGLEKRRDGGTVTLRCRSDSRGRMEIAVSDTGTGIPALFGRGEQAVPEAEFFGIGLRNVAARLEKLYGRRDLLRMSSAPGQGTTVRLLIPSSTEVPVISDASQPADVSATSQHETTVRNLQP